MELYLSSGLCQSARSKEIAGAIYMKKVVQPRQRRRGGKGAEGETQRAQRRLTQRRRRSGRLSGSAEGAKV